jgi:hypothetical protein
MWVKSDINISGHCERFRDADVGLWCIYNIMWIMYLEITLFLGQQPFFEQFIPI